MSDLPEELFQADESDHSVEHDAFVLSILRSRTSERADAVDDADGGYDTSAVMALAAKHGGQCWYCGCALTAPVGAGTLGSTATRDHIMPKSRGGSNRAENIVAACRTCNNAKRAKTVEEYRAKLGGSVVFHGEAGL